MKRIVRLLSLFLSFGLILTLCAGCSNQDGGSGEGKTVELVWYHWGDQPNQPDAVIKALNEKSAEDIGITVKFRWETTDQSNVQQVIASGEEYDIVFACSWFADYPGSAQKNFFMDITELLPEAAPKLYESLPEVAWEGVKVNGKIYGVPAWKDTAATQYWFVNKDYVIDGAGAEEEFRACGDTLASVTPLLEKVKAYHDADPEARPYPEGLTAPMNFNQQGINGLDTGWDALQHAIRVGVKIGDATHTVKSYFDDLQYLADLRTAKEWHDKGLTNQDAITTIEEKKLAVVSTAQGWDGAQYTSWGKDKPYTVEIQKKSGPYLTSNYIQGSVNCIGANSRHPKEALKYLEYLNTNQEYRNMLAYGIEGVNWEKTADGKFKNLTADDWAPAAFAQGSFELLYPPEEAPADMYQKLIEANNNAITSDLLGFVPNTEKVKSQATACASIITEYEWALQTGTVKDVDATVSELLSKLDKQGYRDIIAEYQRQVDEFLANKKPA